MAASDKNPDHIDWAIVGRFAGLAVALLFAGGVWANLHPELGEWTKYARRLPYILGSLGLLVMLLKLRNSRRRKQRERMAAALVPLFGSEWNISKEFSASRFRKGIPRRIKADYPNTLPDSDPLWRAKVEETVRQRMKAEKVKSSWDLVKGKVAIGSVEFRNKVDAEVMRRQDRSRERISNIISHHLRSEVSVSGIEWNPVFGENTEAGYLPVPETFSVKYPETATISVHQKRSLEIKLALKLGGRWQVDVNGRDDSLTVSPRYEFPEIIRHPGAAAYTETTPFGMLYYCVDMNGENKGWQIGQNSTMPHCVVVGATGGGKTTFMRSLVAGAVMQGIAVYGCDPKRVELRPFQDFPGVGGIASSPEQIAALISDMSKLMMYRYEIIEQHPELKSQMPPILFVVDELMILSAMAAKLKAQKKAARDNGAAVLDPMGDIMELLALARTASVHLAIGVQRPDAELFQKGARDNLRHRVSLMRLSREGAMMMWENPYTGLDLPLKQGRCITNLDGGAPVEAQTFWLSEPGAAKGEDKRILDEIAAIAAAKFENYEFPISKDKYALKPGELSEGARRILSQMDIPLGVGTDVDGVSETAFGGDGTMPDVPTQAVNAGSLTEGDTIHLDGRPAVVREVETAGEADEDEISLLLDIEGTEEYLVVDATDTFDRELMLEDSTV